MAHTGQAENSSATRPKATMKHKQQCKQTRITTVSSASSHAQRLKRNTRTRTRAPAPAGASAHAYAHKRVREISCPLPRTRARRSATKLARNIHASRASPPQRNRPRNEDEALTRKGAHQARTTRHAGQQRHECTHARIGQAAKTRACARSPTLLRVSTANEGSAHVRASMHTPSTAHTARRA